MGKKPYPHPCIINPTTGRAVKSSSKLGRRVIRSQGYTAGPWLPSRQPGYGGARGYSRGSRTAQQQAEIAAVRNALGTEPRGPRVGQKRGRSGGRGPNKKVSKRAQAAAVAAIADVFGGTKRKRATRNTPNKRSRTTAPSVLGKRGRSAGGNIRQPARGRKGMTQLERDILNGM